ncbi:MAG: 50S ribosomal protein L3 [Deltaproteobacteria bacterium]|jgi:large subunit ribosomal protein L3|nr:50S ribosomal protein L3 [Deltaproteobacteria bacterium]
MSKAYSGLLGRKVGMTQLYLADKDLMVGVTVLDVSGNVVTAVKNAATPDGYHALQIGILDKKETRVSKALAGHFAKCNVKAKKFVKELRASAAVANAAVAGAELAVADFFQAGMLVDVVGTSKGRGFAGVMKRHNFRGFIRSHGTHEYFRHGGSIGTRLTPGMVLKGKKMPGHMGAARVTVQNLAVVKVDVDRGLVFVKGGVPGANGGYVIVRKAVKG